MQGLIMAAQLIAGISILVILHELGHFWAARAFGIKVEKFYLFFDAWGKKLFSIKIGETEYGIGWLPLGGYVKIAGMIDESMDSEQMNKPAEPWEFRSKPAWQRLIVMIGGVVMNIITGIVIFALISYTYGEKYTLNSSLEYGVVASDLAKESGFKTGDKLKSVNGKEIKYFENALSSEELLADVTTYTVERNGVDTQITLSKDFTRKFTSSKKAEFLTPRFKYNIEETVSGFPAEKAGVKKGDVLLAVNSNPVIFFDQLQEELKVESGKQVQLSVLRGIDTMIMPIDITSDGKIGVAPNPIGIEYDSLKFGLLESFPKVGIAKFYGGEWIWSRFWLFTALISLGLAFMNILPIPALDGGHVVLLLIEMITGKPLSTKAMERIQTVGMVILLTLMVLIFGNDIIGLFIK